MGKIATKIIQTRTDVDKGELTMNVRFLLTEEASHYYFLILYFVAGGSSGGVP